VGLLATSQTTVSEIRATVGRFVCIHCTTSTIVAMITDATCEDLPTSTIMSPAPASTCSAKSAAAAPEIPARRHQLSDHRDNVELISNQELRTVYAPSGSDQINIGTLQQDRSVTAYVDVEEMLSKHFAVLGSTGVANRPACRCC